MLKAGLFITNVISTTFNILLYRNQNYLHLEQISSCLDVIVIVSILFWLMFCSENLLLSKDINNDSCVEFDRIVAYFLELDGSVAMAHVYYRKTLSNS